MTSKMLLVLVLASAIALSNALTRVGLVPPGKELVYEYQARIRVGTLEPLAYASQFILEGKLHLQYDLNNSTLVRFTDLVYRLYNGDLNNKNEYESNVLPLPQETADLLRIFRIEYNDDGKIRNLVTESHELKYSKNIKRAIASILQLDLKRIHALITDSTLPRAFITEERSIYGKGLVEYNVIEAGDEIIVQKMQDVKSSRRWYNYLSMNVEPISTGVPIDSGISLDSHRQYVLGKLENTVYIKQLEAHGGIYINPMNGIAESQYVSVNQSLNLLETIPIPQKYVINDEQRTDELAFKVELETESGVVADLSLGRNQIKKDHYVNLLHQKLDDVVKYLQTNQLTLDTPDIIKGQAINRVLEILTHLDVPTLELVLASLGEKSGDRDKQVLLIFQQILPFVGTRASIVFIRNLIRKNKVSDDIAINLLNKMPLQLRLPSERLLIEVEDLLNLGNEVSLPVRQAAVLSFASLIHKVYAHKSWNERRHEHQHIDEHNHILQHYPGNWNTYHWHWHDHSQEQGHRHEQQLQNENARITDNQSLDNNQLLEKYIKKIVDLLKLSPDYSSQFLYMQALYNIQVGNVAKYLEPYIKGEVQGVSRHLRFLAICADLGSGLQNSQRVYELYWPILTNRKLHLELRAGAYTVIMATKPTMSKLWNIYWFMQSEQCPELYNFYYTHLKSLAGTANPVLQDYKVLAARILKFVRKPARNYLSGNYILDYTDPKYGFGAMAQVMAVSTKTSKTIYIDLTNQLINIPLNFYSLYLKIDGLPQSIQDQLPDRIVRSDIYELDALLKVLYALPDQKNLHIEYAVLNSNQVVKIGYYDQSNVRELVDNLDKITLENLNLIKSSLQIQYHMLAQMILPNDLGLPVVLQVNTPVITNNLIRINREVVNKVVNLQGEVRLQTSIPAVTELSFYNPIPNIKQGITRTTSYDQVIPLNFNLALNKQQHSIKLSLNRPTEEKEGILGLRNHIISQIFISNDEVNNLLKQSNSQCHHRVEVSRGQQYRKTQLLVDREDENTGLRYQVGIINSERQISSGSIIELINTLLQKDNKNVQSIPLGNLLLTIRNLWIRTVLLPGVGTSGVIIRAIPSTVNHVSYIDLSLRLNQEVNKNENDQLPSTKINTRATYSIKTTGDKVVKTLDLNAILELNPGHTINNLKVEISRIVPDQKDYKICIDGTKKWVQNGVTGHLSIGLGNSADGKCVKDEGLIEINMKGEQSEEQLQIIRDQHRLYDECSSVNLYQPHLNELQIPHYHTVECTEKHTSIRRYEYDIKTNRIPQWLQSRLISLLDTVRGLYVPYYSRILQKNPIEENHIRVIAEYPVNGDLVNLEILRQEEVINITGILIQDLSLLGLYPDNYHYSLKFNRLHRLGLTKSCLINYQTILNSQNDIVPVTIGSEWSQLVAVGDAPNPSFAVLVKKVEGQKPLALRVVLQEQILEIIPYGDGYQTTVNGQPLVLGKDSYHYESWFSYGTLSDDHHTIVLHTGKFGLYIDYDGEIIRIDVPKYSSELVGQCFGI